tara:strand:+ start:130 stop:936 length:807 start_codon:yes stop_codon:yes gene_type:complete
MCQKKTNQREMAPTRTLLLVAVCCSASATALRVERRPTAAALSRRRVPAHDLVAATAEARPNGWLADFRAQPPWAQHDLANLAVLPLLCALVLASFASPRAHVPLTVFLISYLALDALWIVVQPAVVKARGVLLAHHAVSMVLCAHPLLHPPHLRYVAWMAVVEFNTFFLILRRHVRQQWVEALFALSWIGIRVCWFPYLPFHWFWLIREPWPRGLHGVAARYTVTLSAAALAALQLAWTRKQLEATWRAHKERQAGDGGKGRTPMWL